jgi:hypothetical protein
MKTPNLLPQRGALAALLLLAPALAAAQVGGTLTRFDPERIRPSAFADDGLATGAAEVPPPWSWRVALAAYGESRPLVLDEQDQVRGGGFGTSVNDGDLVGLRGSALVVAGLAFPGRLEVHAGLPTVLAQTYQDRTRVGIPTPASSGLGTAWAGARWTALSQRGGAPLSLALALDVLAPTGSRPALSGNDAWNLAPRLELSGADELSVMALEVGWLHRGQAVTLGREVLRDELNGGVMVAGRGADLRAEFEVRGGYAPSAKLGAVEVLVGFRSRHGPVEVFVVAGPGFGTLPGASELRALAGVALSSEGR